MIASITDPFDEHSRREIDIEVDESDRKSIQPKSGGRHVGKNQDADTGPPSRDELNEHLKKTQQMLQKIVNSYPSLSPLLTLPDQFILKKKTKVITNSDLLIVSPPSADEAKVKDPEPAYITVTTDVLDSLHSDEKLDEPSLSHSKCLPSVAQTEDQSLSVSVNSTPVRVYADTISISQEAENDDVKTKYTFVNYLLSVNNSVNKLIFNRFQ
jgi:hypothetical protein